VRNTLFAVAFIVALPIARLHSAQASERFDSGPFKGFRKSSIEHIIVTLDEPFNVRFVQGNTLFSVTTEPCSEVLFEIRDAAGNVRGVVSDARGRFKFSGIAPGSYDFKATKDGFQSVTGKIIVSKHANRKSNIQIKMQVGV
jgi:hypothetical protein